MSRLEVNPDLGIGRVGHDDVFPVIAVEVADRQRPAALGALRQREKREPAALVGLVVGRLVQGQHLGPARRALEDQDLASPLAVDLPKGDRARHFQGKPLLGPQLFLVGREPDMDRVVALGVDDDEVLGAVAVQVDAP